MKIRLLAFLLTFAVVLPVTAAAAPQTAPASSSSSAQAPVIKDPAEYNAYMGAIGQKDVNAKISGLEAFLVQYPNSVVKIDALESLLAAYQQAGNMAKLIDTANRILAVAPDNVRALVILAYMDKANQKWSDGMQHSTHGLDALSKWTKPDGVSDAEFEKQKTQMSALFNGVAGMSALNLKNMPDAQKYLRAAVQTDPNNLDNVYPLAIAYLTATPPDYNNGLFFIARAANLAAASTQPAVQGQSKGIEAYGKGMYDKYHGSDDGWNDVLTAAKAASEPPAGFNVTQYVPPTPAQQAADIVKSKEPKDMSFAEWELVLSAGTPDDAAKVWDAIKGKPLQMEGTVISASTNELQIAGSEDDIDAKRADIVVTPSGPIPARLMPKEGATLDFEGTPVSYVPSPFVMTMEKGGLLTKAAPKRAPVHHHAAPTQ